MISGIITKTNGRDKVIDFRDGLVPATVGDYAMLHGAGGKEHAPNSVIKLFICDYTRGKQNGSTTVSANIRPELCEQIFEVCKHNIGSLCVDNNFAFFAEQRAINKKLSRASDMLFGSVDSVLSVLERISKAVEKNGQVPPGSQIAEVVRKFLTKKRNECAGEKGATGLAPAIVLPQHMDFAYAQDRVHNYEEKKNDDNTARVERLQIWHTAYRKQGDLSNYPWGIKITNGRAEIKVQATGATTFNASTMKDIEEAFINISDADMFRMMCRVIHYINVWENVVTAETVRKGLAQRKQERQEFIEKQKAKEASNQ